MTWSGWLPVTTNSLAKGLLGKRLQYDKLIAPNGMDSGARSG